MNDFTKDELEHMANAICLMMAKCSMEKRSYSEIEKIGHKLQSMIDNYDCQVIKAWHCEKCGHVQ